MNEPAKGPAKLEVLLQQFNAVLADLSVTGERYSVLRAALAQINKGQPAPDFQLSLGVGEWSVPVGPVEPKELEARVTAAASQLAEHVVLCWKELQKIATAGVDICDAAVARAQQPQLSPQAQVPG